MSSVTIACSPILPQLQGNFKHPHVIDDINFPDLLDIDDMVTARLLSGRSHWSSADEQGPGDKTFRSYFRQRFKGVAAQLLHRGTTNGGDGDDYR